MKNKLLVLCAALAFCSCGNENQPAAETKVAAASTSIPSDVAPATTDSSKSVSAPTMSYEDYAKPGDAHKALAASNGRWDAEVTSWWVPGQPPSKSVLTTENKMILGGRYQQSTSKGLMDGKSFEGVSTLAFDNARKTYISTWIDNMGTGIMTMEGTFDETTKTINFKGTMVDPVSGSNQTVRETYTFIDKDHQLMQMYGTGSDGKEVKTMQIMFTRKK